MLYKNSVSAKMRKNKSFILFLISQIISCLGDAFYFIAAASLLIKVTGSGTSASFIVICTPISSFFLSPFAGSLGDRFHEKYLLGAIDLLRALTSLAFISNYNVSIIYILMLISASFEILYNPPKKKIITRLLDSSDIMIGNSITTGITGFTFIIGPVIAGIIIELWGINFIFTINSLLYFSSAIILLFIRSKSNNFNTINTKLRFPKRNIYDDIRNGVKYFKSRISIKKIIFISTIANLLIASINIVFYSFAFDILKVNSKVWGVMMSVFYGANLASMLISIYLNKIMQKMDLLFVYMTLLIISVVWFSYSLANNLVLIIFLQFMEGLLISLMTIVLNTKLQLISKKEFVARIIGINDILNNGGKLIAIGITYFILQFYSARFIFILNCIILFSYTVIMMGNHYNRGHKKF